MRATLRFYAELNDFLPPELRYTAVDFRFDARVSVKDVVENHGVPHTEVDLILVNGEPAPFARRLDDGDRVAVYPVFEAFDIASVTLVRPEPLRTPRFALDVHLGRLARYLRLAGFDASYRNDLGDAELAACAARERRTVLTRDRGLLMRNAVTHGYCVRSTLPPAQLAEVVRRFDLHHSVKPFSRCMACNGELDVVEKREVEPELPARSRASFDDLRRCKSCRRVYWAGSHVARLTRVLRDALDDSAAAGESGSHGR